MIRADEDTLTNLVCNWSKVTSSKGWSIDYLHRFQDQAEADEPTYGAPCVGEEPDSDVAPSISPLQTSVVQSNLLTQAPQLPED